MHVHTDVRYNVYMKEEDMITVSEFRKNTKVILDSAKNGPVILRRGDELFQIWSIGTILEAARIGATHVTPPVTPPTPEKPYDYNPVEDMGNGLTKMTVGVEKETPYMKLGGTPPETYVDDLFREKNIAGAAPLKAEPLADRMFEKQCCLNELQPCKHWVWDITTGDGYKNSLSGRLMEVE